MPDGRKFQVRRNDMLDGDKPQTMKMEGDKDGEGGDDKKKRDIDSDAPFLKEGGALFDQMNLGESVITKKHHNWNKIFGNQEITLLDVQPYVDKALLTGKWETVGRLRGRGGKVVGDKLVLVQEVDGYNIWVGGIKTVEGKIIVNNAAVQ